MNNHHCSARFGKAKHFLKDNKTQKQARKGFRPISASEVLLVRKVNNLINKRTEHWSCRIFVQQVK